MNSSTIRVALRFLHGQDDRYYRDVDWLVTREGALQIRRRPRDAQESALSCATDSLLVAVYAPGGWSHLEVLEGEHDQPAATFAPQRAGAAPASPDEDEDPAPPAPRRDANGDLVE